MAMKQVYKYPLVFDGLNRFNASFADRGPVFVAIQNRQITIWAEVRSDLPLVDRNFRIFGTGHEIPEDATHVGSVLDGPYVWHIYEMKS